MDSVELLKRSYSQDRLIRFFPVLSLRDIDEAMFLPILNKSLSEKICAIHIYSNGYKLQEIQKKDFYVDTESFDPDIPVEYNEDELSDTWVRIRHNNSSSFHMRFFEETPKRMFVSSQTPDSLESRIIASTSRNK
jgi:hypothetical protein